MWGHQMNPSVKLAGPPVPDVQNKDILVTIKAKGLT
jgi:hypothetical protein